MRLGSSWRNVWRPIATMLMVVLLVYQVAMVMPLRASAPAMAPPDQQSNISMVCNGSCPAGIVTLCVPDRVCAAVEATLTHLPFTPLLLMVLLILTARALRPSFVAARHPRWLWPPDRRRAFLQVFLI